MKFEVGTYPGCTIKEVRCVQNFFEDLCMEILFNIGDTGQTRFSELALEGRYEKENAEKLEALGFNWDPVSPEFGEGPFELYCSHRTYTKTDEETGEEVERTAETWYVNTGGGSRNEDADKTAMTRAKALCKQRSRGRGGKPSKPAADKKPAAPKPAGKKGSKPPAKPGKEEPKFDMSATTSDEAWAVWCRIYDNAPDATKWEEAVNEIGKGEDQDDFTEEQWQEVANKSVPF